MNNLFRATTPTPRATPRPPGPLTTALLDDLLTNTLDPGYREAARTPGRRRWWDGPLAWIGCLAVGLLLVVAYQQSHRSAPARETARTDLIDRIHTLQSAGDGLQNSSKQLAQQVAALRAANLPATRNPGLSAQEISSGSIAATGPGLVVTLGEPDQATGTEATGRPGTTPQTQVGVIGDGIIRAVVNRLWSSGAEAISINDVRLTPTAAVRFAGESILVDRLPITSPYTIRAIGNAESLLVKFAASPEAGTLATRKAVNFISFSFQTQSNLRLPAGAVGPDRYATRGAAAPSPTSTGSPR